MKDVLKAAGYIKSRVILTAETALVLGSGLGNYADSLNSPHVIHYKDVPGMPVSTVQGHKGAFVIGCKDEKQIICLQGRVHYYEGRSPEETVFPIRVLQTLGIKKLILTNAAGAVNTSFAPGNLVCITDHINLTGLNPLRGTKALDFGERFPSMSEAYSAKLRGIALEAALETGIPLKQGVYYYCAGPSYETPAEIRAIRVLGGDMVGMSTVYETTAAVQAGMEVLGISCITNMAAGILNQQLSHAEVMETGQKAAGLFASLIDKIIEKI